MIKEECGITTDWQHATEEQLLYRDKIHEYISLMCDILNGITMKLSVLVC